MLDTHGSVTSLLRLTTSLSDNWCSWGSNLVWLLAANEATGCCGGNEWNECSQHTDCNNSQKDHQIDDMIGITLGFRVEECSQESHGHSYAHDGKSSAQQRDDHHKFNVSFRSAFQRTPREERRQNEPHSAYPLLYSEYNMEENRLQNSDSKIYACQRDFHSRTMSNHFRFEAPVFLFLRRYGRGGFAMGWARLGCGVVLEFGVGHDARSEKIGRSTNNSLGCINSMEIEAHVWKKHFIRIFVSFRNFWNSGNFLLHFYNTNT